MKPLFFAYDTSVLPFALQATTRSKETLIVINPNEGPGSHPMPEWQPISTKNKHGHKLPLSQLVGYTDAVTWNDDDEWKLRSKEDILTDINRLSDWYKTPYIWLDDCFLDRPGFKDLVLYLAQKMTASASRLILNCGDRPKTTLPLGTVLAVCDFEKERKVGEISTTAPLYWANTIRIVNVANGPRQAWDKATSLNLWGLGMATGDYQKPPSRKDEILSLLK